MQKSWQLAAVLAAACTIVAACDSGTPASGDGGTAAPAPAATVSQPASTGTESADEAGATDERPVVTETLPYAEVEDQLVYGHFAFPADMVDPLPGIIVIHERWGLDDNTRNLAERLAGQGFVVLAVDLFGGKTATSDAESSAYMLPLIENPEPANENIRQAYQFLLESGQAPRIGALGWSFGGGWALNAALLYPNDLDAAVIYYGQVTDNEERLTPLNVPILGLFGEDDRSIDIDAVREFESVMEGLGKEFQVEVYPGAGHAFADPTGTDYNEAAADQAWEQVVTFLGRYLGASSE